MGDRSSIARKAALPKQPQQDQLFDTHPEVSLDFEIVREAARQKYHRPFLIVDTAIVRDKVRRFRAAMPRVRPHYAVKANPDRRVLKVLAQEGAGFEIASTAELDLLLGLGVPAAEVFYSNPVKSRESIAYAAAKGVEWFVVDSADELQARSRGEARRQAVPAGSRPPTSAPIGRFRASSARAPADAREIVALAAKLGADLAGVTFHVGSQCRNPENWRVALEKARALFELMTKAGLKPRLLNIGGGYPVRHVKPIPSIEVIGEVVNEGLKAFPGRRAGDRRARALPRVRRGLFRVPRARHRHARRQALDALGRGPLRRRHRVERGAQVPHPFGPLRSGCALDRRRPDLRLGRRGDAR